MGKSKSKAAKKSKGSKKSKAKKVAVEPPTSELWEQVKSARHEERKSETAVMEATEVLKSAKKRLDGASEHLGRLLDDAMNGQEQLPFGKPAPASPAPAATDDAWKSVKLEDLNPKIKPAKLKALASVEPPIVTLGDLTSFQESHGEWWAKNVKGLGDGGVEQIVAATDAYWAANPRNPEDGQKKATAIAAVKEKAGEKLKSAGFEITVQARTALYAHIFEVPEAQAESLDDIAREASVETLGKWYAKLDKLGSDVIVNIVKSSAVAA